jgi:hypothetical protein
MRIVDPAKLGQHRELVDTEVVSVCLDKGVTRQHAYAAIAIDLGVGLNMRQASPRWWAGVPCRRVDGSYEFDFPFPEFACIEADEKLDRAESLIGALRRDGDQPEFDGRTRGEVFEEVKNLISGSRESTRAAGRKHAQAVAATILNNVVLGTSPDGVATSLLLLAIDANADVFMTPEVFETTYPSDTWPELVDASASVKWIRGLVAGDAPSEVDKEHALMFSKAFHETAEGLKETGPTALDR